MVEMKVWFARSFYIVAIYWWCLWSRVYRALFQRKYRQTLFLDCHLTAVDACKKMRLLAWTRDGGRELWDSVGDPGWVQHVINRVENGCGQPVGALDCDDFSVWASNVLSDKYDSVIWVFSWMNDGELSGHAMCWCSGSEGKYFHIGNWGMSREYSSLREACEHILSRYSNASPIGWSLLTKNLWPIAWGVGLPDRGVGNGS